MNTVSFCLFCDYPTSFLPHIERTGEGGERGKERKRDPHRNCCRPRWGPISSRSPQAASLIHFPSRRPTWICRRGSRALSSNRFPSPVRTERQAQNSHERNDREFTPTQDSLKKNGTSGLIPKPPSQEKKSPIFGGMVSRNALFNGKWGSWHLW